MITVLVMAAVLWGIGVAMGAPRRARWTMILVLYAGVLLATFLLPPDHPLRVSVGGDGRLWLLVGGLAGLGWAYGRIVARLRAGARRPEVAAPAPGAFSDGEVTRYARHIALREIGGPGQRALREARVLVVGAGGLGSPALLYLAAAGVGTIGVIDPDTVEATNLQRQIVHADARIGMPKVHSAAEAMGALNPYVTVRPYERALTADIAADLFADYDLILDGTDGFATRVLINAAAVAAGKPVIGAALTQWEGQISLWHPARGAPCLSCVFPVMPDPRLVPTCAEAGVAGPLPGVMGTLMAMEAVKEITGAGAGLAGTLLLYDGLGAEFRRIRVARRADCAVCGPGAAARAGAPGPSRGVAPGAGAGDLSSPAPAP